MSGFYVEDGTYVRSPFEAHQEWCLKGEKVNLNNALQKFCEADHIPPIEPRPGYIESANWAVCGQIHGTGHVCHLKANHLAFQVPHRQDTFTWIEGSTTLTQIPAKREPKDEQSTTGGEALSKFEFLKVQPGDRVMVVTNVDVTVKEMAEAQEKLESWAPDVSFAVISGVNQVAVIPASET